MLLVVGLAAALPLAASAGGGAEGSPSLDEPVTLVRAGSAIYSFAQDDETLAWEEQHAGYSETRSTIKVRSASGGRAVTVSRPDGGDGPYTMQEFALAGRRVLWGGFVSCCNHGYGHVETAAPGSKPKVVHSLGLEYWTWGEYPTGAAGDGTTLAFSIATVEQLGRNGWRVTGGGVWRVVGSKSLRIARAPTPALLAASRGTIALVPADMSTQRGDDLHVPIARGARVEVRDAATGALRASFAPKGSVAALGMDGDTVVVLVRVGKQARVEWYSASSGKALGTKAVGPRASDRVDVSGHTIVFQQEKTILSLDTRTRKTLELARARSKPVGLSIEGGRVAWAENAANRGAVRSVTVD
jgi:hypothetical protein